MHAHMSTLYILYDFRLSVIHVADVWIMSAIYTFDIEYVKVIWGSFGGALTFFTF